MQGLNELMRENALYSRSFPKCLLGHIDGDRSLLVYSVPLLHIILHSWNVCDYWTCSDSAEVLSDTLTLSYQLDGQMSV